MADVSAFTGVAVNVGMIILVGVFFIVMAGVMAFLMAQYKKWSQFNCVVWGIDAFGQVVQKTDKAGIFVDRKTQNKRFYMRKAKVGLDCNNVPYIPAGKGKTVYLLQTGLKNFRFIKPDIAGDLLRFDVGEEDVNWAVNAYQGQKKIFSQSMLMQYMPFIALAFVSIIILIMFIYFFKQFPVLKETAQALSEAAKAYSQSQGGTVVLS